MRSSTSNRSISTRMFALVFALILCFASVSDVLAATIQNGEFYNHAGCSLTGWTTSGNVSTVDGVALGLNYSDTCVAKVYVVKPANGSAVSMLSQTFEVRTDMAGTIFLQFQVWSQSSNGVAPGEIEGIYKPQTIRVKDSTGAVIFSASHNYTTNSMSQFAFDVTAYKGEDITLEVSTSTNSLLSWAPSSATMYIDSVIVNRDLRDGRGVSGW
jgi:hypothetical protein